MAAPKPQSAPEQPIAQTIGVSKSYKDDIGHERVVLQGIDFAERRGETVAILGP